IDVSLNFIAPFILFYLFFNRAGLLAWRDFKRPDNKTLLLTVLGFLFMNSSPVIMTTRHGQITMFFSILLLLTIYARHRWSRTLFFGIAAGMKYSMIVIFAPALFLKKHYLTCILAFGIFALIAMAPAIFGNNLIQTYSRYVEVLQGDISGGFNNYAVSGYNMLQLEFFKFNILNSIAKLLALLLAFYIIFRDRQNNSFGMNFLFAIMCLSMLLCYHRLYDTSVIMLCLIANLYLFILKKDLKNVVISLIFAGFFIAPLSAVIIVAERIGTMPYINKVFIMCQYYQDVLPVFPLNAIMFLLLTGYAVCLYFRRQEDIVFALSK
ncbi:MAG: glycosyltransferase 87 family protein, partial [Victivallaceae bacterium]